MTAGAYITTDADSNQFTGFNPGAMKYQAGFNYAKGSIRPNTLAIVGPGNLADMMEFTARNSELGIYTIFDPGPVVAHLGGVGPGSMHRAVQLAHLQRV